MTLSNPQKAILHVAADKLLRFPALGQGCAPLWQPAGHGNLRAA